MFSWMIKFLKSAFTHSFPARKRNLRLVKNLKAFFDIELISLSIKLRWNKFSLAFVNKLETSFKWFFLRNNDWRFVKLWKISASKFLILLKDKSSLVIFFNELNDNFCIFEILLCERSRSSKLGQWIKMSSFIMSSLLSWSSIWCRSELLKEFEESVFNL